MGHHKLLYCYYEYRQIPQLEFVPLVICFQEYSLSMNKTALGDNNTNVIGYDDALPPRSDIKAKGLCIYNKNDFNWRLSRIQKKTLLEYHGRELMITTPTIK